MLASDRIFATSIFHEKMETLARANVRREIDFWSVKSRESGIGEAGFPTHSPRKSAVSTRVGVA